MSKTRGDLVPATVVNLDDESQKVECMFNPSEFTLVKQNQWQAKEVTGSNVPEIEFQQGSAEQLQLRLFFDTYSERDGGRDTDVRTHTAPLWDMMMVRQKHRDQRQDNKSEPPYVEFRWGRFAFKAVITNINQKFSLFNQEGVPLRTEVMVTLQQVNDPRNHHRQNPTSGGGPPLQVHIVQSGDRLDLIAAKWYSDSTQWRRIAQANALVHPLRLREGQTLVVPSLE